MTPSASTSVPSAALARDDEDDAIHLSEYFDILLDRKWLVASVTAVALVIGTAYALLATPIYQSNLLIQRSDCVVVAMHDHHVELITQGGGDCGQVGGTHRQ